MLWARRKINPSHQILRNFRNKKTLEYSEEFDYVKKLYLNKFSLINGQPLNQTPSDKSNYVLMARAIEQVHW